MKRIICWFLGHGPWTYVEDSDGPLHAICQRCGQKFNTAF